MLSIFTTDDSAFGYPPALLAPHTTSADQEESVIVRRDQRPSGTNRESEIYQRARQIYYRGRRTSMRRTEGIL